jgi:hypothetical protein
MKQVEHIDALPEYRLRVTWRDGTRMIVDFAPDIKNGGVWTPLKDPKAFAAVSVSENGETIEWDEPRDESGDALIDVDADGLFMMGVEQAAAPLMRDVVNLVLEKSKPT